MQRQRRRLAGGENLVDEAVGGGIVTALETRQVEHRHIGMAGGELRRPDLLHAVGGIVFGPHVAHIEHVGDAPLRQVVGEEPLQVGKVLGDRAHRQQRITQ